MGAARWRPSRRRPAEAPEDSLSLAVQPELGEAGLDLIVQPEMGEARADGDGEGLGRAGSGGEERRG